MKQMKKQLFFLPMNLQFFAEGDGTGTDGAEGAAGGNGSGADGDNSNEPVTFDDFLQGEGNQAEFDRRVQKAVNTALTNAQEKWKVMTDDKLSEADKLAKMNKEEKAQYLNQKREKELNDKETAITRRELMAESKVTLADKGIPIELSEILDYTNADTCKTSMEKVEQAFQKAVEKAVDEKLKGGNPPKKKESQDDLAKQVMAAMSGGLY